MARERRQILFSPDEVKDVARLYLLGKGHVIGSSSQMTASCIRDARGEVCLIAGRAGSEGLIEIKQLEAIELLADYCRRLRVPLPRASRRSLDFSPEGLVLNIEMESSRRL